MKEQEGSWPTAERGVGNKHHQGAPSGWNLPRIWDEEPKMGGAKMSLPPPLLYRGAYLT